MDQQRKPSVNSLKDKVAVVTGASRGAGRAIAAVLGEAGATVYATGRTVRGGGVAADNLPGTVEDAADEVTARGGRGVAVRCDHTVDADVEALFKRVRDEQGHLDLMVNNIWGGYEGQMMGLPKGPFWEQPRGQWQSMFVAGVRAHLVASQLAAPLMIESCKTKLPGSGAIEDASTKNEPSPSPSRQGRGIGGGGLIVSTVGWAYGEYLANLCYDVSKAAIIRMIRGMAHELRPFGVAAIALAPGFMRTERIMAVHAAHPFDLGWTESPEYAGRAVRALAEDAKVMEKSGEVFTVGDLAREYGFTDIDGRQPAAFRMPKNSEE
jgi:NAD(P)-dependent dehydrogenase (short-subunit alcohol dehydrogenase family)